MSGARVREAEASAAESPASEEPAPFSGEVALERAPKISTCRPRARSSRPPVRVDDVGDRAVLIAAKVVRSTAPKALKTRGELTDAPIDSRDAYVLSLVDGKLSVPAIVDIAGMPEREIVAILERLARLGIVSLA